jgi:hypothetical protein
MLAPHGSDTDPGREWIMRISGAAGGAAVALLAIGLGACTPPETGIEAKEEVDVLPNPVMLVEPTLLDFGAMPMGDSAVQSFFITNLGVDPLTVENVVYAGAESFTQLTGSFPIELAQDQTVEVQVEYSPLSVGESGAFTVTGDDLENPSDDVVVLGSWALPALAVEPTYVEFGALPPNCEEATNILLKSVGSGPVTVNGLSLTGAGYTLEDPPTLPLVLQPGEEWALDVSFLPLEEISYEALLEAASDDPTGVKSSEIYGVGLESASCDGIMTYELEFEVDYKIGDIAFLIDTTCSMSSTANAVADEFGTIAARLAAEIPDITFGAATYDDYPYGGYGAAPDKPFELRQQQTDDVGLVGAALANEVVIHNGSDWEESTIEAIYQAASGEGYDMNCNGSYTSDEDVKPFIESPLDAFNGAVQGKYNPAVPGTGELGGMGFRDETFPIIIYATDAPHRDPEDGYGTPGGCNQDASFYNAYTALSALGSKLIGVCANCGPTSIQWGDAVELALVTGSMFDANHDGVDEPAVVEWSSGDEADFRETVVDAVLALVDSAWFDKVSLEIEPGTDPQGLILDIEPDAYYDIKAGTPVTFTLTIDGSIVEPGTPGASEVLLKLMANDMLVLSTRTLFLLP